MRSSRERGRTHAGFSKQGDRLAHVAIDLQIRLDPGSPVRIFSSSENHMLPD